VPFQHWVLYLLRRKERRTAQEKVLRAYHCWQNRQCIFSFFRIWKHLALFGNIDHVHSRNQLLYALEQQKLYCLALEKKALAYQEVISTLEASLEDEQKRLHAKEDELEKLVMDTQATR
jgi:hypothetical protein